MINTKPDNGYAKTNGKHQDHFIERVNSLPVVHDSISKMQQVANATWIGRKTLATLKSPINIVYGYLEPHLDTYGSRSLDYVQAKVPLIERPNEEVIQVLRESPGLAYQKITANSRQKLSDITQALVETGLHQAQVVQEHLPQALQARIQNLTELINQLPLHEKYELIRKEWSTDKSFTEKSRWTFEQIQSLIVSLSKAQKQQ